MKSSCPRSTQFHVPHSPGGPERTPTAQAFLADCAFELGKNKPAFVQACSPYVTLPRRTPTCRFNNDAVIMVPVAGLASRRQSTTSFGDKDVVRL